MKQTQASMNMHVSIGQMTGVEMLEVQLPLKAAKTGEDPMSFASRFCAASAFFRGHPSPVMMQRQSSYAMVTPNACCSF